MKRIELTVSRTIPAPPAEVFDVWLDAKSPGSPWFGAERVILDPVVDGLFYHSIRHEGRTWAHYGRFVRVQKPRVVEHTWLSEATHGVETTVTVTLEPKGAATLVTLRHTNVPDDDLGRGHEAGWNFVLGALADRLATSRPAGLPRVP
jgi:uncharacterized protein YndB with AHSA1/START domain